MEKQAIEDSRITAAVLVGVLGYTFCLILDWTYSTHFPSGGSAAIDLVVSTGFWLLALSLIVGALSRAGAVIAALLLAFLTLVSYDAALTGKGSTAR